MSLFLSIVIASYVIFGFQVETGASNYAQYLPSDAWIRYRISLTDNQEQIQTDLSTLQNHPLLLTITNSDETLREYPCSPVSDYQGFADRVNGYIELYHPKAVELWNEPDAGAEYPNLLGCNWSARQYADFVWVVCKHLKQTHPDVIMLAGALATSDFDEYLDPNACGGVSFHFYTQYANNGSDWHLLNERIQSLRKLGFKQIWITETSLLDDPDGILQAQWYQYVREQGVPTFWYTIGGNGWRNSDMIDGGIPKPVWNAYQR